MVARTNVCGRLAAVPGEFEKSPCRARRLGPAELVAAVQLPPVPGVPRNCSRVHRRSTFTCAAGLQPPRTTCQSRHVCGRACLMPPKLDAAILPPLRPRTAAQPCRGYIGDSAVYVRQWFRRPKTRTTAWRSRGETRPPSDWVLPLTSRRTPDCLGTCDADRAACAWPVSSGPGGRTTRGTRLGCPRGPACGGHEDVGRAVRALRTAPDASCAYQVHRRCAATRQRVGTARISAPEDGVGHRASGVGRPASVWWRWCV